MSASWILPPGRRTRKSSATAVALSGTRSYEIEGDLDLRTFVGLAGPRAGFTAIRATSWVKSPNATTEQLEELCQYVQETSPVRDSLANPIPVSTDLIVVD
jgi:organic hydroperoxide reductase OsmC/OhrA